MEVFSFIQKSKNGPIFGKINGQIKNENAILSKPVDGKSALIVENPSEGYTKELIIVYIKLLSIIWKLLFKSATFPIPSAGA